MDLDAGKKLLLEELASPTPLSHKRLVSVWHSFGADLQLQVLAEFKRSHRTVPKDLLSLILDSDNSMMKVIAIRNAYIEETDEALIRKILGDQNEAVRTVFVTAGYYLEPSTFYELPHIEKLAYLQSDRAPGGDDFSEFIKLCLENELPENEISQLVAQYTFSKKFIFDTEYHDGGSWYITSKWFEGLWNLVVQLPTYAVRIMIEKLQVSTPNGDTVPDEILNKLDGFLVSILLWRTDVELTKFRRTVFFESWKKYGSHAEYCRAAACSCNFELDGKELGNLFSSEEEDARKAIIDLALSESLAPVQLMAIEDFLKSGDAKDYSSAIEARRQREENTRRIESSEDDEHRDWRKKQDALYRIARNILPWGKSNCRWEDLYAEDDLLELLKRSVKGQTTWEVYGNLRGITLLSTPTPLDRYLFDNYSVSRNPKVSPVKELEKKMESSIADLKSKIDQNFLRAEQVRKNNESGIIRIAVLLLISFIISQIAIAYLFQI